MEIRRRVGVVFQDPDDQLFMPSVREDVAFGPANLGIRGQALEARVVDALDPVGMVDFIDRPPHHLSFGQRRRVAVATVLAMEPEVLVLDEPSSNLDPASRRELADILRSLDVTVLMVTYDLPYAYELCPRSVVLSDGVVVADGTRDVLTDDGLMSAHRLELPFGFDLAVHPAPDSTAATRGPTRPAISARPRPNATTQRTAAAVVDAEGRSRLHHDTRPWRSRPARRVERCRPPVQGIRPQQPAGAGEVGLHAPGATCLTPLTERSRTPPRADSRSRGLHLRRQRARSVPVGRLETGDAGRGLHDAVETAAPAPWAARRPRGEGRVDQGRMPRGQPARLQAEVVRAPGR